MDATSIAFSGCSAHDCDVSHFGKALIELRAQRRMTQDDLAQAAGISRSLVQSAERMRVPKMRVKNYLRLAKALGFDAPDGLDAAWGQKGEVLATHRPRVQSIDLAPDQRRRLAAALTPYGSPDLARWLGFFIDYLEANKAFAGQLAADVYRFGTATELKDGGATPIKRG